LIFNIVRREFEISRYTLGAILVIMEQVKISEMAEFHAGKVIKKVPILTDQLMATVLYINSQNKKLVINDSENDRIYYIVKGMGKLKVGELEKDIEEGEIILAPRQESLSFSTNGKQLIVLSVRSIKLKKRC
jgi:mannose-6-phosphate isomerase-like protein (cupin superfamily)